MLPEFGKIHKTFMASERRWSAGRVVGSTCDQGRRDKTARRDTEPIYIQTEYVYTKYVLIHYIFKSANHLPPLRLDKKSSYDRQPDEKNCSSSAGVSTCSSSHTLLY